MKQRNQQQGKITTLTISAILGSNSLLSRQNVMRLMVREWHGATPEPHKSSLLTPDPQHLALAKSAFEEKTGMVIDQGGFYTHADEPFLGASITGFLSDDTVEIIFPPSSDNNSMINAQNYIKNNCLYHDIIQLQLHCVGADICHFIVCTPHGIDSTIVKRSEQWMETHKTTLHDFIATFLKIINSKKLSQPYLSATEYNADHDSEWLALAQERLMVKTKLDQLNKTLKDINNQLIDFAKKKECKVVGGGIQAFKMVRKGAIQYAKIPELKNVAIDQYRKKDAEYWSVR